jgi:hypothetical protein
MRTFKVNITGVTPYMQHRMDDKKLQEWEVSRGRIIERDGLNTEPEKMAAFHSYIDEEGNYYIPDSHFKQAFVKGGAFVKGKVGNSTKSMKNVVAAMWMVTPSKISFRKFDGVDTRSAVNRNIHARIIVYRPIWYEWSCELTLVIDDDDKWALTEPMIRNIIDYAGRYIGVGSYRPEHTGEFGRFRIDSIELI